jgi:hypothetical protein
MANDAGAAAAERDDGQERYERALGAELVRRIGEFATYGDDAFGRMGPKDALAITLLFVLGPALIVWLCR